MSELDALDPVPETVKLSSGTEVALEPLRARQFFKFLRIITHGAVPAMQNLFRVDDMDAAEFGVQLLTVTVLSIPDAEDETVEFIRSMCKPVGVVEGNRRRQLSKSETERNTTLWAELDDELDNPEIDDLVSIVEAIVRREAADMQALGKRLASMFRLAEKTGQVPSSPSPSRTSTDSTSSADSAASTTSSRPSTGGRTKKSTSARSAGSANA
jgi:hypothetical protein